MSYICGICKEQQPNGTKANMTSTRKKIIEYPYRSKVFRFFDEELGEWSMKDDPGGKGFGPVKDVTACATCAEVVKLREKYGAEEAAKREERLRTQRKAEKRQRELSENREKVDRIVRRLSGRERDGSVVR